MNPLDRPPPDPSIADQLLDIRHERDRIFSERETLRHVVDQRDELIEQHVELDYVLQSFLRNVERSRFWRWLQPLRTALRWLRPNGFDARALIAWRQIEATGEPNQWTVTGSSPHFLVPCLLPKGWLRVTLRMSTDAPGFVELRADPAHKINGVRTLGRIEIQDRIDREFLVYIDRPVKAIQFAPLDRPAQVRIDEFRVRTVSPPAEFADRTRRRLSGFARGFVRRASLLARGRFAQAFSATQDSAGKKLNVVYVLKFVGLCGGVKVVLEHVSRLQARGHNVCLYHLGGDQSWFSRQVPERFFASPAELQKALNDFRGIKVATWWETAPWVADSLAKRDRGYYLVQDVEDSYASTNAEAAAALATYQLPLTILTEGVWVRNQLAQRFGRDSVFVSIGLDHQLFQPGAAAVDVNRILTQARTWSGGGAAGEWLKGWPTARDAVLRCREKNPSVVLTTFSLEKKIDVPRQLLHVHFCEPSDRLLIELYRQAGLYLMTSNHEGFGLTAAEAMACGCPVVTTAAHGNEEFCIDGVTALVAPAGDAEALADKCLRLQSDPQLSRRLVENAKALIGTYTWDRVVDRLEREFLGIAGPEIEIPDIKPQSYDDATPLPCPAKPTATRRHAPSFETPPLAASRSWVGEYPRMPLRPATFDCSVVIPSVGTSKLVEQCVRSCRDWLPADASVEFIVVDDGTPDRAIRDELRRLAKNLDFRLLFNGQNLGFSATVNRGMRSSRGKYVVLCNNDIRFVQPWFEALRAAFADDPRVGIVGACLLYPNGAVQHAGMDKVPGQLTFLHAGPGASSDDPAVKKGRHAWSVTGAFFAIRRKTLRRLGGLSTGFCTAYEDVDYCLHAWSRGERVLYCGDVVAQHVEGGTRGAKPSEKDAKPLVWSQRQDAGQAYFEKKWEMVCGIESFEMLELWNERRSGQAAATRRTQPSQR